MIIEGNLNRQAALLRKQSLSSLESAKDFLVFISYGACKARRTTPLERAILLPPSLYNYLAPNGADFLGKAPWAARQTLYPSCAANVFIAFFAAAIVFSMTSSVCLMLTKAHSNCEGAR
jgi:hypothetical protein